MKIVVYSHLGSMKTVRGTEEVARYKRANSWDAGMLGEKETRCVAKAVSQCATTGVLGVLRGVGWCGASELQLWALCVRKACRTID